MEKTVRLLSNGNQIDFVVESNGLLCMYCGDDLFTADFDYKGVGVLIRTLEELRKDMARGNKRELQRMMDSVEKKSEPAVCRMEKEGGECWCLLNGRSTRSGCTQMEYERIAEDVFGKEEKTLYRGGPQPSKSFFGAESVGYANPKGTLGERMKEELDKAMAINADRQGKQDEDFLTFEKKAKAWQELNKPKK